MIQLRRTGLDVNSLAMLPPWEWPEETAGILMKALQDTEAPDEQRVTAAELAGEEVAMNDDVAEVLLKILTDSSEPDGLRETAAIAFGPALACADMFEFEDPEDVPISEDMYKRVQKTFRDLSMEVNIPVDVKRRVLEASVRDPQDWHADLVRRAYADDNPNWKLTAVFCMQYIPGFEREILESLHNTCPETFYFAVISAGRWEMKAAWRIVFGLLDESTEKDLLLAAIEAAFNIDPEEAAMATVELAFSEDEEISDTISQMLLFTDAVDPDDNLDDDDVLF